MIDDLQGIIRSIGQTDSEIIKIPDKKCFVVQESYHNSKPVKSGKPSHWGGGLGFYLVFPTQRVGNGFCQGGCQKAQDNESFFKVTPLIWAIEDQNNESYMIASLRQVGFFYAASHTDKDTSLQSFESFYLYIGLKLIQHLYQFTLIKFACN